MRLLVVFIILSTVLPAFGQSRKELKQQWNFREKDRLLEAVKSNSTYTGLFYDRYSLIEHELIPQADNSFVYIKNGLSLKDSCVFESSDPNEIVVKIMKSYLDRDSGCKPMMYQPNVVKPSFYKFRLIGYRGSQLVGLAYYQTERSDYYQLHEINQNGVSKSIDETKYYDSLRPIAIANDKLLMYDEVNSEIFINHDGKKLSIPQEVSGFMLKSANSPVDRMGSIKNFIMTEDVIYTPSDMGRESELIKIDSEDANWETISKLAASPVLFNGELLYFKPPIEETEEAFQASGLFKKRINKNKSEQIFNSLFAESIGFQGISYVPLTDDKLLYQIIDTWGSNSQVVILDLNAIKELQLLIEEGMASDEAYQKYRRENPTATTSSAMIEEEAEVEEAETMEEEATESTVEEDEPVKPKKPDPQLEKLKQIREQSMEEFENKSKASLRRYHMPEGYFLIPNPINYEPLFVSGNPDWPILIKEDLLPLESN